MGEITLRERVGEAAEVAALLVEEIAQRRATARFVRLAKRVDVTQPEAGLRCHHDPRLGALLGVGRFARQVLHVLGQGRQLEADGPRVGLVDQIKSSTGASCRLAR